MKLWENVIRARAALRKSVIIILLLLPYACLEPYAPSIITEDYNILVVDGFLIGNDTTFIRLGRTAPLSNTESIKAESNATLWIEAEGGIKYPLTEKETGLYVTPPLSLIVSNAYRLHIKTNDGKEYLSEYVKLKSSPPLDSVTWKEELTHDNNIEFSIYSHDPENNTRYYLWTYDETWQYVSAGISIYYFENEQILPRNDASAIYNCWNTVTWNNMFLNSTVALSEDRVYDFHLYSIPQKSRKLYFAYSVLTRQYAITKEAYEYLTLVKNNSESLGGLFDLLPSQPGGNIASITNPDEPVIGFFDATTVQTKRVSFTRQDITGPSSPYEPTGYEDCDTTLVPTADMTSLNLRGKLINEPYYDAVTSELLGYIVYEDECLDCRMRGGTTKKPDFWD